MFKIGDEVEVWKPVANYENCYEVSNYGKVKNLKRKVNAGFGENSSVKKVTKPERILKQHKNNHGYMMVCLSKNNKSKHHTVHSLVAKSFIKNKDNKPCVNHIDGDKTNNNINNLEWVTYSENVQHALRNKIFPQKPVLQIDKDTNEIIQRFESVNECSEELGISKYSIYCILNNQSFATRKGLRFIYE